MFRDIHRGRRRNGDIEDGGHAKSQPILTNSQRGSPMEQRDRRYDSPGASTQPLLPTSRQSPQQNMQPLSSTIPINATTNGQPSSEAPPRKRKQLIPTWNSKAIASGDSGGIDQKAAPAASWNISEDKLRRMEANTFLFKLVPMWPEFPVKVDMLEDYREKVTTQSARGYLVSAFPLYSFEHQLPNRAQKKKIIYYELDDIPYEWGTQGNIWSGFSGLDVNVPPGLGLGSFGINRKDGNLYYNKTPIGKRHKFEFASGTKIGIGIVFSYADPKLEMGSDSAIEVRVFHTRRGALVDNILVDDVRRRGGFDGHHDLFATVGTFDRVLFKVSFEEKDWAFKPREHNFCR
jgi:hypothetical protein